MFASEGRYLTDALFVPGTSAEPEKYNVVSSLLKSSNLRVSNCVVLTFTTILCSFVTAVFCFTGKENNFSLHCCVEFESR